MVFAKIYREELINARRIASVLSEVQKIFPSTANLQVYILNLLL